MQHEVLFENVWYLNLFFFSLHDLMKIVLFNLLFWTLSSVLEAFLRYLVILIVFSYLKVCWTKSLTNNSEHVTSGFTIKWFGQYLICWKAPGAFLLLGVGFHERTLPMFSLFSKGLVACVRALKKEAGRSVFHIHKFIWYPCLHKLHQPSTLLAVPQFRHPQWSTWLSWSMHSLESLSLYCSRLDWMKEKLNKT